MQLQHREVIVETKMVQITTTDERWYSKDWKTFYPSVTWIADQYPKGVGFYKWLADKGWDESIALKEAGGVRGSKVDAGFKDLVMGKEIKIDAKYANTKTGAMEELTVEEYEALMSFKKWYDEVKPEIVAWDITVWNEELRYAGTIDLIVRIDGKLYIVDIKTSQTVWKSHRIQVNGYKYGYPYPTDGLAILQLGYKKNKDGYKWTEIEDDLPLLKTAIAIWNEEHGGEEPKQRDYPMSIKLDLPVKPEQTEIPMPEVPAIAEEAPEGKEAKKKSK